MKNRTHLIFTNEYDLLTKINRGLYKDYFCVLELIEERKIYSKKIKIKDVMLRIVLLKLVRNAFKTG